MIIEGPQPMRLKFWLFQDSLLDQGLGGFPNTSPKQWRLLRKHLLLIGQAYVSDICAVCAATQSMMGRKEGGGTDRPTPRHQSCGKWFPGWGEDKKRMRQQDQVLCWGRWGGATTKAQTPGKQQQQQLLGGFGRRSSSSSSLCCWHQQPSVSTAATCAAPALDAW